MKAIRKYRELVTSITQQESDAQQAVDYAITKITQQATIFTNALNGTGDRLARFTAADSEFKSLQKKYLEARGMLMKLKKIEKRVDQLVRKHLIQLRKDNPDISELDDINYDG